MIKYNKVIYKNFRKILNIQFQKIQYLKYIYLDKKFKKNNSITYINNKIQIKIKSKIQAIKIWIYFF